jgi:uncharacterized protein
MSIPQNAPLRRALFALAIVAALPITLAPLHAQGTRRGLEQRSPAANSNGGFGTYHAVIFAVGEQRPGSGLPSLKYPLREADSLRAVITRDYTFEPNRVQVVKNPTREAILDTLEVLARRLGPEDNLLVVYSGHGGFDEGSKEGYWQATDAANSRPSTWIANDQIRAWLRKLKARSVLLITDACFSGSLNRSSGDNVDLPSDAQRALAGALLYARRSSRQAMTAGTARETVPQISVFSMEIVAALKRRQTPVYLAQQLAAEINPRVAAVSHTTPTFSAVPGIESDQGDFVFVRRATAAATDVAVAQPAVSDQTAVTGVRRGGSTTQTNSTEQRPLISPAPEQRDRTTTPPAPAPVRPSPTPVSDASSKTGNFAQTGVTPPRTTGDGTAARPVTPAPSAGKPAPACDGGTSTGCVRQGQSSETGTNGISKSVPRALELFRIACEAGDGIGCANLGRLYDAPREGVSMDRGKARTFYAQACERGVASGCTYSGIAALKGEGGPVDEAKAVQFFARACDGGDATACGYLGNALLDGRGTARNETLAITALTRGCDGGAALGCSGLGTAYANGRGGVSRDSVRAVTLWRSACTAGAIPQACGNLGAAYQRGSGIARDDARAVQYLSQACESNYGAGCTGLAQMYEAGSAVTAKSPTRAAEFYRRGCTGGDERACVWTQQNPPPTK